VNTCVLRGLGRRAACAGTLPAFSVSTPTSHHLFLPHLHPSLHALSASRLLCLTASHRFLHLLAVPTSYTTYMYYMPLPICTLLPARNKHAGRTTFTSLPGILRRAGSLASLTLLPFFRFVPGIAAAAGHSLPAYANVCAGCDGAAGGKVTNYGGSWVDVAARNIERQKAVDAEAYSIVHLPASGWTELCCSYANLLCLPAVQRGFATYLLLCIGQRQPSPAALLSVFCS